MSTITAAKQAKLYGLKKLAQVTEVTGVSSQTLDNWQKTKPELFRAVCLGSIKILSKAENNE
jgi:hypothetical protein